MVNPTFFLKQAKGDAAKAIETRIAAGQYVPINEQEKYAQTLQQAIINLLEARKNIGQAVLAGLWEIYVNKLFTLLGEYNEFHEWVKGEIGPYDDAPHLNELVLIVTQMLAPIYEAEQTGKPFIINGEPLTVQKVLETRGLIYKLRTMHSLFDTVTDDPAPEMGEDPEDVEADIEAETEREDGEDHEAGDPAPVEKPKKKAKTKREKQEQILDTVMNGTRQDVETLRDELRDRAVEVVIHGYMIEKSTVNGILTTIVMEDLTPDEVAMVRVMLGRTFKPVMAQPKTERIA